MLNVDGISIYTKTYGRQITDNDQIGQFFLGQEELKVRRIGHDAMMEQDAVHIGYKAGVAAHLLNFDDKSDRTPRHRSANQCDADKNMKESGFHQRRSNTLEPEAGSRQSRRHLCGRKNSINNSPDGRKEPLDEFSCGGKPG